MAAVIGFGNELPDVLKDHYPQLEDTDPYVCDLDGNIIDGIDF
jgi:hypothetical protein